MMMTTTEGFDIPEMRHKDAAYASKVRREYTAGGGVAAPQHGNCELVTLHNRAIFPFPPPAITCLDKDTGC